MLGKFPFPWDSLKETIGVFVITGISLGVTGAVTVSQFDASGGIISSILLLVVILFGYLLGPILAMISGLRIGNRHGRTLESYIIGGIGSGVGYILMMVTMILTISIFFGDVGAGGGGDVTTTRANAGSELQIGEQIINILQISVPSAISGIGGIFIAGDIPKNPPQKIADSDEITQDKKEKILKWWYVVLAIILLVAFAIIFIVF